MPHITYRGKDENGMPAFYVGEEKIEGILYASIDSDIANYMKVNIEAIFESYSGPEQKEATKQSNGFTFKEGIAG